MDASLSEHEELNSLEKYTDLLIREFIGLKQSHQRLRTAHQQLTQAHNQVIEKNQQAKARLEALAARLQARETQREQ